MGYVPGFATLFDYYCIFHADFLWKNWLGIEDSNLGFLSQSQASYHWTNPQKTRPGGADSALNFWYSLVLWLSRHDCPAGRFNGSDQAVGLSSEGRAASRWGMGWLEISLTVVLSYGVVDAGVTGRL